MTCKDCYHYAVCHLEISFSMGTDYMTNKMYDDMENRCSAFKDESKIIELPCKVGDDIYCISGTQIYKAKVHCVSCGGKYSTDWQFHIYDCDKDNACVLLKNYKEDWFLSKSEAEAKLKELLQE